MSSVDSSHIAAGFLVASPTAGGLDGTTYTTFADAVSRAEFLNEPDHSSDTDWCVIPCYSVALDA